MTPPSKSESPTSSPAILPLAGLAWLALLYTWLIGHFPFTELLARFNLASFLKPSIPFWGNSFCLFKQLTHLPCVFCGMTRSFILIGQGKPLESIPYHWLGIPTYLLACLVAILGLCYPDWTNRILRIMTRKLPVSLACGMLLICWLWKIGHEPRFW